MREEEQQEKRHFQSEIQDNLSLNRLRQCQIIPMLNKCKQ